MNIISVAPCYVGLLWVFYGLLGELLVWVLDPIFAPCLGHEVSGSLVMVTLVWAKHEISEASLSFEEVESWIVWMKDGALPSVVHSIGKNSFLVGIPQKCCPWFLLAATSLH